MQDTLVDIADNVSRKRPANRSSFVEAIKGSLSGFNLKIIDTHNTASIIFIIRDNVSSILLKAEFGANTSTHKEIQWYERQAAAGKDHRQLFISGEWSDSFALLFLRYIEGVLTLDEWVLTSSATSSRFSEFIVEALAYDRALLAETSKKMPQSVIERFLLDRYRARRDESKKIAYLHELLSTPYVFINGTRHHTPDYALQKLAKNPTTMAHLLPAEMGLIHGDLHAGNVLIKDDELYYVDPNGTLEMPIEYDIGKMLHSLHGQYPLIMRGEFVAIEHSASEYEYTVYANKSYAEAHEHLRRSLTNDEYLRSMFAEALHFGTMLPHHAKNRDETMALFLRATEIFGELLLLLA